MIAKWKPCYRNWNVVMQLSITCFIFPSLIPHTHTHTHRLLGNREEDSSELEEVSPEERNAILRVRELKKEIKVSRL